MVTFQKAVKSQAKLRLSITGPAGSGKTFSALSIAAGLASGGRVALVDTEHGSAKKHSDEFDFDVMEMEPPFHPDRFVEAIRAAQDGGYDVLILDSLSHAWNGTGGLLEIVEQIGARMKSANSFAAWKDATPIQNHLVDAIVRSDIHIIATMRSKTEYVIEQVQDDRGRTKNIPRKIGTSPIQRDSFEYEFDVVTDIDLDHNLIVSKTRYRNLDGAVIAKPSRALGESFKSWLSDGAPATPQPFPFPVRTGNAGILLKRIKEVHQELEYAGDCLVLDPAFLSTATEAELTEFGKGLRQRLEVVKSQNQAMTDPDDPEPDDTGMLPGMEPAAAGHYANGGR